MGFVRQCAFLECVSGLSAELGNTATDLSYLKKKYDRAKLASLENIALAFLKSERDVQVIRRTEQTKKRKVWQTTLRNRQDCTK